MYLSKFNKVVLVSDVFMSFWTNVTAQNFQSEHFDWAHEFAYRKSGINVNEQCQTVATSYQTY